MVMINHYMASLAKNPEGSRDSCSQAAKISCDLWIRDPELNPAKYWTTRDVRGKVAKNMLEVLERKIKENFPWEEIRKAEIEYWDRIRKELETQRANEELSMKELVREIGFV
jgi:hypothetical protein